MNPENCLNLSSKFRPLDVPTFKTVASFEYVSSQTGHRDCLSHPSCDHCIFTLSTAYSEILDDSTVVSIVDELLHVSNLPSAAVSGNVKDYLSITTITTAGKHSLVTPAVKTSQQSRSRVVGAVVQRIKDICHHCGQLGQRTSHIPPSPSPICCRLLRVLTDPELSVSELEDT